MGGVTVGELVVDWSNGHVASPPVHVGGTLLLGVKNVRFYNVILVFSQMYHNMFLRGKFSQSVDELNKLQTTS